MRGSNLITPIALTDLDRTGSSQKENFTMKTIVALFAIQLCCLAVNGLSEDRRLTQVENSSPNGPLQPPRTDVKRRTIPKYIIQIYQKNLKEGKSVNLHCTFPKMIQTKRAIKLIFKNNSLKQDENAKWKHDELRLFMATAKKSITRSNASYVMKIFDLYNDSRNQPRVPVNKYTFKTTEYGWKTLNISAWREQKPKRDSRGRFGMLITIFLGKKKLNISKTAFRKVSKKDPYFIEFFHEEEKKTEESKPKGKSMLVTDRFRKNTLPALKSELEKRDYYLPFQQYESARQVFQD